MSRHVIRATGCVHLLLAPGQILCRQNQDSKSFSRDRWKLYEGEPSQIKAQGYNVCKECCSDPGYFQYSGLSGFVYLIHAKGSPRFKLGRTFFSPMHPLSKINEGQQPYPLVLVHSFQTDDCVRDEIRLHSLFYQYNVYSEWFELSPKAVAFFLTIQDGSFTTPALGDTRNVQPSQSIFSDRTSHEPERAYQ